MNRLLTMLSPVLLATSLQAQGAVPAPAPQAPDPQDPAADLTDLSLEELMQVPCEVGTRSEESLAKTAASVFVLSEPEIRRSGMRSLPDLLRLVPGLIIAQDVPGAFGFSSRLGEHNFAGMLVLLDGERLYTTLLRREYWQALDLPVENIARIEVIRGPGGARWGDKASQGVINIVTKKAKDAAGGLIVGSFGTEERAAGSVRYGGAIGAATDYYVYAKMAERDGGFPDVSGDRWGADRLGARIDTDLSDNLHLTVDGEYHESYIGDSFEIDPGFTSQNSILGGHLKGRLRWDHDDRSSTELRLAVEGYDQDIRDFQNDAFYEHLRWREELFTTTLQHSLQCSEGHRLSFGIALRHLTIERHYVADASGDEYNEARGDAFAAWDWDFAADWRLTLGGNIGYVDGKDTQGVDTQPDIRLAWTPSPDFTVWTGISANDEPDRRVRDSGLLVTRRSSRLSAYELGVRRRWDDVFLLQADGFVYDVERQENGEYTDPGTGATLYMNGGRTQAYGGELSCTWNPAPQWRVSAFLATTQADAQNFEADAFTIESEVPRTRGGATIGWEPLAGLQFDTHVLYTEQHYDIPTWWRVDLRIGYAVSDQTHIEVVGQNLTDPHHQEYWYLEESERGAYFLVSHRF